MLNDYIKLLLQEDANIEGQEYYTQDIQGKWKPLVSCVDPVRRGLCSNEFVFDIDTDKEDPQSFEKGYRLALNLETVLRRENIPFLRFTTGRLYHYNVFFDKFTTVPNEIWQHYFQDAKTVSMEQLQDMLQKLRCGLFLDLVGMVEAVEGAWFDTAITTSRHLIRLEGCKNETTGFYKSYMPIMKPTQPKVTEENVMLPRVIPHWSNISDELMAFVYKNYITKSKKEFSFVRGDKIPWIEELLAKGIDDGRHRTVNMVLAPYLMNVKKLSEQDALDVVKNWLSVCNALKPVSIPDSYVQYQLNYAQNYQRTGLKPLTREKFEQYITNRR